MANHRAKLLRESSLVHCRAALALNVSRHRDKSCHRENTGTANTCYHNVPGLLVDIGQRWFREGREIVLILLECGFF